ncbi:MAG: GNAT family N-acetyltransferase [Burkholderiaceae bacterium]|nr:GNAT family N-acetyltransferase [Burkholderiaceae bacterium]
MTDPQAGKTPHRALRASPPHRSRPDSAIRLVSGDWTALGEDASRVRTEVFVGEQGIAPELEWDAADARCLHCVAYDGDRAVGTGRLLPDAHVGRMAVLAPYRRTGVGGRILGVLVDAARARGETEVVLSAQAYVVGFYARHGFEARGVPYDEVGIEHQEMTLGLEPSKHRHPDPPLEDSARIRVGDASELFVRQWRPATDAGRGVYLLHGLGEHIGRHDALARWFCARGWRVCGHDHVGHGKSSGARGVVTRRDQMRDHAVELIEAFARELSRPPLIVGQSMGGALAAALVHSHAIRVEAMLLSAPAFDPGATALQRAAASVLGRIAPTLTLDNGLDAAHLSRDASQVRAYVDDPLVHRRICARLFGDLVRWGQNALAGAPRLDVATLLLVPAADRIVNPQGARRYAADAPAALLRLHDYAGMRHEPFHELPDARAAVYEDLERWLAALDARPQPGNA